jgi:hypothetical protein
MPGADPVTAIANAGETIAQIVSKFIPDKDQAAKLQNDIQMALISQVASSDASQATTNTAEAGNLNLFVSGWRPAVGWVCVAAFAWSFLFQPVFSCFFTAFTHQPSPAPALDMDQLMFLLSGLLGLGGLRTLEKFKGVARA